jgi:hypothetical protein
MAGTAQPVPGGSSVVNPAVASCSTAQAKGEISVYVCVNAATRPPIAQAGVQATNDQTHAALGAKQTDTNGHAVYESVDPATYTVTVTLTASDLIKYAWPSTDGASVSATDRVGPNSVRFFPFLALPLARPKIQVLWQEDDTPVGGVKVRLGETVALTDTVDNVGIAELAADMRGLRANSFHVNFTFPSKNVELMDARQITVSQGSTDTYPFHIRKCWVEFVVQDGFQNTLEEGDYVLTYADGTIENGSFVSGDNGKIHKDVPPGDYKFELKWLSEVAWGDTAAEIGKAIKLQAKATGFTAGDITFGIYDACAPSGTALDSVTASSLKDGVAEGEWTPDIGKLDKVTSGFVVFIAKVGKQSAASPAIPISSKRVFNVTGPDGGPLETELVLFFSNGFNATAQSPGGKAEPMVPLGCALVCVQLSQTGVRPEIQLAGASEKQTCYIPA